MAATLYQIAPSFYSQIARLALVEKGVDWKERQVNLGPAMENYKPWFMTLHPKGVVPVLDHDGTIVTETRDIIDYIDNTFDGPALKPTDSTETKRMYEWIDRLSDFTVREYSYGLLLNSKLGSLASHSFDLRRKILKRHMRNNPELAELYQARLDGIDAWQKISKNPDEVEKLQRKARTILDDVEKQLSHGQSWLLGNQFTLVDIWLTIFLARLRQLWNATTNRSPDQKLPASVDAYYARLKSRPSFQKADVWEAIRPWFMVRMIAPYAVPRLLALAVLIASACVGLGWAIGQLA